MDTPSWSGIARIDMKWRLLAAIAVALTYAASSRAVLDVSSTITEAEIYRTPLRLAAAAAMWILMRDVIVGSLRPHTARSPALMAILLLACATPILIGGYNTPLSESIILAVTCVPVAMLEELFFRGIIQNLAVRRWGIVPGLALMTALFTAYHVGVIRADAFGYAQVILMGLILGVLYMKTGSIVLVIAVHTVYNALDSLPRLFPAPDRMWGLALLVPASLLALVWLGSVSAPKSIPSQT